MKKLFCAMMAIVALFATSCQKENFGEETTVSFTISTPEIATRAYSDGTTATHLQYAVYDNEGKLLTDLTKTDATINGSETGTSFRQALYFKKIGFNLHDTMIYHKKGLQFPESNRYYPCFEY